jgi:DNA-binding NtrC family response regulator
MIFPAAVVDTTRVGSPFSDSCLVVLVDDEERVRAAVRLMLEAYGDEVVEAADAQQGLDRLQERMAEVVLVVLDIMMPVRDGLQALERREASASKVPVVWMSRCHDSTGPSVSNDGALNRRVPKASTCETLGLTLAELRGHAQETGSTVKAM